MIIHKISQGRARRYRALNGVITIPASDPPLRPRFSESNRPERKTLRNFGGSASAAVIIHVRRLTRRISRVSESEGRRDFGRAKAKKKRPLGRDSSSQSVRKPSGSGLARKFAAICDFLELVAGLVNSGHPKFVYCRGRTSGIRIDGRGTCEAGGQKKGFPDLSPLRDAAIFVLVVSVF